MNNYQEEFYNNIDFTPLYNYINKLLNIELHYDKELHTQMRVIRDILDCGAVDDFTFNTAVERE